MNLLEQEKRDAVAEEQPEPEGPVVTPVPPAAQPRLPLPRPRLGGMDDPQFSRARTPVKKRLVTTRPGAPNGKASIAKSLPVSPLPAKGHGNARTGVRNGSRADGVRPNGNGLLGPSLLGLDATSALPAADPGLNHQRKAGAMSNGDGNGHPYELPAPALKAPLPPQLEKNAIEEPALPAELPPTVEAVAAERSDRESSPELDPVALTREIISSHPSHLSHPSLTRLLLDIPASDTPATELLADEHQEHEPRPRRSIRPAVATVVRAIQAPVIGIAAARRRARARPPRPAVVVDPRKRRRKLILLVVLAIAVGSFAGLMTVYSVDLSQVEGLEHFRPISTTQLYDVHGGQVGSFALERRVVVGANDFAPVLRDAVLSIEDKDFDSHWGVNIVRVAGAAYRDLTSSGRVQGASTLTMQLSRNLFLSNERTFGRKVKEVLFSIQLEHHFTKDQIFTLYGNQIYLGHGMYGFEAASGFYFNKHARELTLPEAALLAGIPKSPNGFSPLLHPERALVRRNHVLREMLADGRISAADAEDAEQSPLGLNLQPPPNSEAPWFVEEIRRSLEKQFGADQVHTGGLKVYTTMDLTLQRAATKAVLDGLAAYERRHGWKGHLQHVDMGTFVHPDWSVPVEPGGYVHGVVTLVEPALVSVKVGDHDVTLAPDSWTWTGMRNAKQFLTEGDVVYVHLTGAFGSHVDLEQDSGAQAALLSIDNTTGDILAMVGGRDFQLSQFNRATQAQRQTGSSFKPYVYAAAVEAGARPEDRIDDDPTTFPSPSGPYTPHNFDNEFKGNISLLAAFADSRNIPALKLAAKVGMNKVIDIARRCGVTSDIPAFLPVALGAASLTLLEHTSAYSVFANDGLHITPRLVHRVTTADDHVLAQAGPQMTSSMSPETAQTMLRFLQEVVRGGTAAAARSLNHPLAGKTGTTNNFTDAWFMGFSPSVTTGVWVGYDDRTSLGEKETGAHAALPIWMDYMRVVTAMHPGEQFSTVRPQAAVAAAEAAADADVDADETGAVAKPEGSDDVPAVKSAAPAATDPGAPAASAPGTVTPPVVLSPAGGSGASTDPAAAKPAAPAPAKSVSGVDAEAPAGGKAVKLSPGFDVKPAAAPERKVTPVPAEPSGAAAASQGP